MHADIPTLQTAHELGMAYTFVLLVGAARCNTLSVVQFLRAQDCPWSYAVFRLAAARGDTDMCAYLQ
jgi:hypothetical protein